MSENNLRIVRRFLDEVWSRGNYGVADELLAENHVHHLGQDELRGPAAVKEFAASLRRAFPDLRFTIEDELADADKVAIRWTASGTHSGQFAGVEATGRRVHYSGIDMFHLRAERIVQVWVQADAATLMEQLIS